MVIHEPKTSESGDEICLSADIEIKSSGQPLSKKLWFKFSKSGEEADTPRSDCFAASLLPLAMALGEDLEIQGTLSPRLAHGMQEYQRIQTLWKPDIFKPIKIKWDRFSTDPSQDHSRGVGCAFSGGVDSFYTVWSHLPENEPNPAYRISHCLMINGFDWNALPEKSDLFFKKTKLLYGPMMDRLGLRLVLLHTNLWEIMDKANGHRFMYTFGSALAGSALALGHLFSRFYIASSFQYTQLFPWGSHPLLDPLWSTEALDILHDGAHVTRSEKIISLSQWPETYTRLRPCLFDTFFINEASRLENCCRCESCVPIMAILKMLGRLDRYPVFPKPLTRRNIRNVVFFDVPEKRKRKYFHVQEMIDLARKQGRKDIIFDLYYAKLRNRWLGNMWQGRRKKTVRRSIRKSLQEA